MGLSMVFFFFECLIQFTEAGKAIASVKATVNHNLSTEAIAKTASIKAFCPPQLRFLW